ncbi:UNKNOWN [Stylonychia lemnae]|uniref:Uncharacterized protein n=1 Tax=Stylonychia lemnae TaxID=5949 RepID=A0A078BF61_STYLE|nr:UNKNOWN [Stylonychia lemnae]|eukprot:CDW91782.1 UNKNOWN [Stylonychia lemnae]
MFQNPLNQILPGNFGQLGLPPSQQNAGLMSQGHMGYRQQYMDGQMNQPMGGQSQQSMMMGGMPMSQGQFQQQSPYLSHQNSQRNGQNQGQKSLQQRRDLAKSFFKRVKQLPKPQNNQNIAVLQDTERILQILTNASYVEKKNRLAMRRDSEEEEDKGNEKIFTDEVGVQSYYRNQQDQDENYQLDENADQAQADDEWRYLDIEDKKILSKRKKRTVKVEDCYLDLDAFFKNKKRFCPSESILNHDNESTQDSEAKTKLLTQDVRDQLKKKLIEKYFSELPENEYTQRSVVNYIKYMIKNVQYNKLTRSIANLDAQESMEEEEILIELIQENDPLLLLDITSFWIYNAFSISSSSDQKDTFYEAQLRFILMTLEKNINLILFEKQTLHKWISFIKAIPFVIQDVLLAHVSKVLNRVSIDQLDSGYLQVFIEQLIMNKILVKKDMRDSYLKLLVEDQLLHQRSQEKFDKICNQIIFCKETGLFEISFDDQLKIKVTEAVNENFRNICLGQQALPDEQDQEQYLKNSLTLYIEIAKIFITENDSYLEVILDCYFKCENKLLKTIMTLQIGSIAKTLNLDTNNQKMIELVQKYSEEKLPDFKTQLKILVDILVQHTEDQNTVSQEFKNMILGIAKTLKSSTLLSSLIFSLDFELVQDHIPAIIVQVEDHQLIPDIRPLIENIEKNLNSQQDKIVELVYLILKQTFESSDKQEQEQFIKRLTTIQDILIRKFNKETVAKIIEKLIKREKWHCKILISLILLLVKFNSPEQNGVDSYFKDEAMNLIKKILKKKIWDQLKSSKDEKLQDEWDCIKKGLVLYFTKYQSKDNYKLFKDYIPSEIREEMIKENQDLLNFVNTYSRR